jgi:hypothetical protein
LDDGTPGDVVRVPVEPHERVEAVLLHEDPLAGVGRVHPLEMDATVVPHLDERVLGLDDQWHRHQEPVQRGAGHDGLAEVDRVPVQEGALPAELLAGVATARTQPGSSDRTQMLSSGFACFHSSCSARERPYVRPRRRPLRARPASP